MTDPVLAGHSLRKWVEEIRWRPDLGRNVAGPRRGFGCECGVDYTSDDPYAEHVQHIVDVQSRLARRRWADHFLRRPASRRAAGGQP